MIAKIDESGRFEAIEDGTGSSELGFGGRVWRQEGGEVNKGMCRESWETAVDI